MGYTYKQTEPGLWTVGNYDGGCWEPDSDHDNVQEAVTRMRFLNGGGDSNKHLIDALLLIIEENYDDDDKNRHLKAIIDRVKSIARKALVTADHPF